MEGRTPGEGGSCSSGTVKIASAEYSLPFRVVRTITEYGEGSSCDSSGMVAAPSGGCACGGTKYINCGVEGYGKYCYGDTYGKYECLFAPFGSSTTFGSMDINPNPSYEGDARVFELNIPYTFTFDKPHSFTSGNLVFDLVSEDNKDVKVELPLKEVVTEKFKVKKYTLTTTFNPSNKGLKSGMSYQGRISIKNSEGEELWKTGKQEDILIKGETTTTSCGPNDEFVCQTTLCAPPKEKKSEYDYSTTSPHKCQDSTNSFCCTT